MKANPVAIESGLPLLVRFEGRHQVHLSSLRLELFRSHSLQKRMATNSVFDHFDVFEDARGSLHLINRLALVDQFLLKRGGEVEPVTAITVCVAGT